MIVPDGDVNSVIFTAVEVPVGSVVEWLGCWPIGGVVNSGGKLLPIHSLK